MCPDTYIFPGNSVPPDGKYCPNKDYMSGGRRKICPLENVYGPDSIPCIVSAITS